MLIRVVITQHSGCCDRFNCRNAGSVTDNYSNKEPSGVIRGYDVNTGKLLWVFDTGAADPNAMPGQGTTFVHTLQMLGHL